MQKSFYNIDSTHNSFCVAFYADPCRLIKIRKFCRFISGEEKGIVGTPISSLHCARLFKSILRTSGHLIQILQILSVSVKRTESHKWNIVQFSAQFLIHLKALLRISDYLMQIQKMLLFILDDRHRISTSYSSPHSFYLLKRLTRISIIDQNSVKLSKCIRKIDTMKR